jgi:hypothetical protein
MSKTSDERCDNKGSYGVPTFLMNRKPSFLFQKLKNTLDFQVTSCHHFDTTNVVFAYIESE